MDHRPGLCFAPDRGLCLDLWLPDAPARAVVLYLHGGGFMKGSRDEPAAARLAARILPEGLAFASADYRLATPLSAFAPPERLAIRAMRKRSLASGHDLAPRLCGPAFAAALFDASDAVGRLRSGGMAAELCGLPVVVLGISAGGIAALSLAYPPAPWGARLTRPDAVIALAAAMVQPWRLVPPGPTCLLFHGPRDRVIDPAIPRLAARRAAATGADIRLIETGVPGHNSQIEAFLGGQDAKGRPFFSQLAALVAQIVRSGQIPRDVTKVAP